MRSFNDCMSRLLNLNVNTPLHEAVIQNKVENVKSLLATISIKKLNAKNENERTALEVAAFLGHSEIFEILMNKPGIDKTVKWEVFRCHVIMAKNISIIETFLKYLPQELIEFQDKEGKTLLHYAVSVACFDQSLNSFEIVRLLLDKMSVEAIEKKDLCLRKASDFLNCKVSPQTLKVRNLFLGKSAYPPFVIN